MTTSPMKPRERVVYVVLGLLIILCFGTLYLTLQQSKDKAESATGRAENAEEYAARVARDCEAVTESGQALRAGGLCPEAKRIAEKADDDPLPGRDGRDGKNGINGTNGTDGTDGRDGRDGRGVSKSVVDANGDLILTYSDGFVFNAGHVVGPAGPAGPAGRDGMDGTTPDLSGYATEDWVRALIRALGCQVSTVGHQGPPLLFSCSVTDKP